MPVSYRRLSIEQLLCHDGAYKLIDIAGRLRFENWDIQQFEKNYLGCGGYRYIRSDEDMRAILQPLITLDVMMPFLRKDEQGKHYAYEPFLSRPGSWLSRGAPFFWAYTSRRFTYDPLPMAPQAFSCKYMSIVQELNIPYGMNDNVYVDMFAAGGLSSGQVNGMFVKDAHDKLWARLEKYSSERRL